MKPMLACPAPTEGLVFPLYASAKVDGIRCLVKDGRAWTRRLELIPNEYVQYMLGHHLLNGLDGELVVGAPYADDVFNVSQSGVMRRDGQPAFKFLVFDFWNGPEGMPFASRYDTLRRHLSVAPYNEHPFLELLPQLVVNNTAELLAFQEDCLERGYEGVIVRSPDSPYKFGRSTATQGWMMKVKKFASGTAVIDGYEELMRNDNELTTNALGQAKRSKAKAGMVPGGTLGALKVRDIESDVPFKIGSGYSAKERDELWAIRDTLPGKFVEYTHFEIGVKTAPRFPIYKALRDALDVGDPV